MILGFFLGVFFMFVLANILGFINNRRKKEQAEIYTKQIEKWIEDTIGKQLKNQKGLERPINVLYDKQRDKIHMSKSDWDIVAKTLIRVSNTKQIECLPTCDFFIQ